MLPPPVAYANVEQAGAAHLYGAKLDDLLRDDDDQQHHLYINVGPEATEVRPFPFGVFFVTVLDLDLYFEPVFELRLFEQ